jgi:hypothetical protein
MRRDLPEVHHEKEPIRQRVLTVGTVTISNAWAGRRVRPGNPIRMGNTPAGFPCPVSLCGAIPLRSAEPGDCRMHPGRLPWPRTPTPRNKVVRDTASDKRRGHLSGCWRVASDLRIPCALGGTRTPNLLIRRSVRSLPAIRRSPCPRAMVRGESRADGWIQRYSASPETYARSLSPICHRLTHCRSNAVVVGPVINIQASGNRRIRS